MPTDTLTLARRGQAAFRARLTREDLAAARRLQASYRKTLFLLHRQIGAFEAAAESAQSGRALAAHKATLNLHQALRRELALWSTAIDREAKRGQNTGVVTGYGAGLAALNAIGVNTRWNQPSVESIQALVNYTNKPEFRATINRFGTYEGDQFLSLILTGAARGQNPVTTAKQAVKYLNNIPLFDAIRTVRTVSLWSMRSGSLESYRAHSDKVFGWVWNSALDSRTCMSCIAQHGSEHDLSDLLNDHHLGRCTMLPLTAIGSARTKTGEEWFNEQTESFQKRMMGPGKWQAWKDGAFPFSALSVEYDNPVYGKMRREATLQELVGKNYQPGKPQPFTGGIRDIKTSKNAEDWVKRQYPHITPDFSQLDPQKLKIALDEFDKLAKQWPEVAARLEKLTASDPGGMGQNSWIASASRDGKEIRFSRKYYGMATDPYMDGHKNEKGRWTVSAAMSNGGQYRSAMTHEFGHMVDNWLRRNGSRWRDLAFSKNVGVDGTGLYNDLIWEFWKRNPKATATLSRYATTNPEESAAEAFSAIYNLDKKQWPQFVKRYNAFLEFMQNRPAELGKGQWTFADWRSTQAERDEVQKWRDEVDKMIGKSKRP